MPVEQLTVSWYQNHAVSPMQISDKISTSAFDLNKLGEISFCDFELLLTINKFSNDNLNNNSTQYKNHFGLITFLMNVDNLSLS
jgi:hypothetical protein